MAYVYRCGVCKTTSKPGDGYDAEQAKKDHRNKVHHGQIPDNESIEKYDGHGEPGGLMGCLVIIGGLVLLAAYGWIKRRL